LPASVIIATLILSATIFMVGGDISKQISLVKLTGSTDGSPNNNGNNNGNTDGTGNGDDGPLVPAKLDLANLSAGSAVSGSAGAKVTIIEFSDFQCPFCKNFYSNGYAQIKADYIDSGKAKIVFKNMPLDNTCNENMGGQLHPEACNAAKAAVCAGTQGKFWEMHDKLFENQSTLSSANYSKWAGELGLNAATFSACMSSNDTTDDIKGDISDATAIAQGIAAQQVQFGGTPSFIIVFEKSGDNYNKVRAAIEQLRQVRPDFFGFAEDKADSAKFAAVVVGAQGYSTFKQVLDAGAA